MDDPATYLAEIEMALVASPIVAEYRLVRSWANTDDGYIRDYRHQWMDATKTVLRRRWDTTPDHPELDGFPYHCHIGDEGRVVPSEPVGLIQVLALIEAEIGPPSMD